MEEVDLCVEFLPQLLESYYPIYRKLSLNKSFPIDIFYIYSIEVFITKTNINIKKYINCGMP